MAMEKSKVTPAMEKALMWLDAHGMQGVVDRYGNLVAGGERCTAHAADTWLRLCAAGLLVGYCTTTPRIIISADGIRYLGKLYKALDQKGIPHDA